MSDDFGTINVNRGERAREIEVLRQHYRQHREALVRMIADAPTEHLAAEYQRLVVEIDRALGKLNELESSASMPPPPVPPSPDSSARLKTEPGMRPLVTSPIAEEEVEPPSPSSLPPGDDEPRSRVPLILGAALVVLLVIGWLIWRASSDRGKAPALVETATDTSSTTGTDVATSTAPDTALEETPATSSATAPAGGLAVAPLAHDYGVIRKGTRATRQFEVTNRTDDPISISVARSACRCLYYEHAPVIPPRAKETLTVTIDGAKAKAGELHETLTVSAKKNPAIATKMDVQATIR